MFRYLVAVMLLTVVYIESVPLSSDCPENEEWDKCGGLCEPSCFTPSPIAPLCLQSLCTGVTAGCRCKHGYARDDDNHCIWITHCNGSLTYF
ncbi:chymotrypsin inhibitor-like isoform X1 [Halictus rubicundus]|uniref:chymotrypsin inhibitor-like isoform X1 n=1 Tax=Halictus rubicundus TaxID=77578 RepID=UPI004036A2FF